MRCVNLQGTAYLNISHYAFFAISINKRNY